MFPDIGKILIAGGIVAILTGLGLVLAPRFGVAEWFGWLGRLPLDLRIEREGFSFYFPLGTSILLSLLLSVILYFINALTR